jgi:hypothetical protein
MRATAMFASRCGPILISVRCTRSRRLSASIGTAVVAMLLLGSCGSATAPTGMITGGIYLSGGPANRSGGSACGRTRCPGSGTVTVRDSAVRVVARARLRSRQRFRFVLAVGTYKVSSGPACTIAKSTVRAGKTSGANILCNIK